MPIEFPLGTKAIPIGRVANPVIPLLVRTHRGDLPFDFLIDTGADCSMIPLAIAETELGVKPADCPQDTFFGIEGHGIRVYRGWLPLKIGGHPLRVRCVFSTQPHCPLILGRMDLFHHFSITFDNRRPVTGRWQAERHGVRMGAGTWETLGHMIDTHDAERDAYLGSREPS